MNIPLLSLDDTDHAAYVAECLAEGVHEDDILFDFDMWLDDISWRDWNVL